MKDFAPGHFGDVDRFLQKAGSEEAEGWKEKRKAKLIEAKTHRAIVPVKGLQSNAINVLSKIVGIECNPFPCPNPLASKPIHFI